jgi:hypothetical protein
MGGAVKQVTFGPRYCQSTDKIYPHRAVLAISCTCTVLKARRCHKVSFMRSHQISGWATSLNVTFLASVINPVIKEHTQIIADFYEPAQMQMGKIN